MRSASGVAINSSAHSIQRKTVGFVFVREKDRAAQASILSPLVPGKLSDFSLSANIVPANESRTLNVSYFNFAVLKIF
jgi:hypothetical protein